MKHITSLFRVTTFVSSTVSHKTAFCALFRHHNVSFRIDKEHLYLGPFASSPIWKCRYHMKGDKMKIINMMNKIVDNKDNIEHYGFMVYDIDTISCETKPK